MDDKITRVSVLSANINASEDNNKNNLKKHKTSLIIIFSLAFCTSIMTDLSVFLLDIPNFSELQTYKGIMDPSPNGRHNPYMSLRTEGEEILFTCRISAGKFSKCLNKEQRQLSVGKKVEIYSYPAAVNGIFYENRLLQLEIDEEIIISYENQKSKYILHKNEYMYLSSILSGLIFFGFLIVYWVKLSNSKEG